MRATLYEALGIRREATDDEVRAALRAQIRKYYARTRDGQGNDFQSVLQTQATVLSVEDGVANAQATLGVAHVRLYKALGGGWQPEAAGAAAPAVHGSAAPPAATGDDGAAAAPVTSIKGRT